MTRDEYIQQVEAVLSEHTSQAAIQLGAALADAPPKTQKVEILILVDQAGAGFLHVRVELVGPDSSALNRAIADYAGLFGTRLTEGGFDPALPFMEPGGETFSVHDALTDCAASWVATVWRQTNRSGFRLPITVMSRDRYGSTTPFHLNHDTNAP